MDLWIVVPIAVLAGLAARAGYRRWRANRIAARRRVEEPNSHYTSQLVRDQRDRERWRQVDLERLHPINREEVERLLNVVEASGPEVLSPRDRVFLETMTRLSFGG